jgi:hypothetical protein
MLFIVLFQADDYAKNLKDGSVKEAVFNSLLEEMRIVKSKENESQKFTVPLSSDVDDWIDGDEGTIEEFNRGNYTFYLGKIHLYILTGIATNEKSIGKNQKIITLCLNKSGELYRDPKSKYCYEMDENSDRCKIVRLLLATDGYKETQSIADELEKNKKTLRTEIGKINNNIDDELNCKDFLQGKKGSGYRINPKYKVTLKN